MKSLICVFSDEPEEGEGGSLEAMPQGTPEVEGTDTNFQSTPEQVPMEQPLSDGMVFNTKLTLT